MSEIQKIESSLRAIVDLFTAKAVITAEGLEGAGKLPPAKAKGKLKPKKCACSKAEDELCECDTMTEKSEGAEGGTDAAAEEEGSETITSKLYIPIEKASDEEQIALGIVLQPEVVDAQGDIYSADVIKKAAHKFLATYNASTKLGIQHKQFFGVNVDLVESYIAPMEFVLGKKIVKAGSWLMAVRVNDKKIWKKIKDGEIGGFSIGGKATVKKLEA